MHHLVRTLPRILVLAPVALGGCLVFAAPADSTVAPRPHTIVDIEGDRANGFSIHYYDGSTRFPPTRSEARAECSAYETRVDRVRCRVEVRTRYHDLRDTQRALDWAHHDDAAA